MLKNETVALQGELKSIRTQIAAYEHQIPLPLLQNEVADLEFEKNNLEDKLENLQATLQPSKGKSKSAGQTAMEEEHRKVAAEINKWAKIVKRRESIADFHEETARELAREGGVDDGGVSFISAIKSNWLTLRL